MSKIDWSKAPEWADGHGLVAHHGITQVWINMDQYAVVGAEDRAYAYGGGTGDHRHNFTRGQVQYITPRPLRWNGEGLPPVGAELEAGYACEDFKIWHKGVCVAVGICPEGREEYCVVQFGDVLAQYGADGRRMRPIRTPEQVAADERLHKLRNAHTAIARTLESFRGDIPAESVSRQVIEAMIDAGYSKQVAP
ncbi:hypothetical protein IRZ53_07160 [Pseudomonas fulva]|uniref:hypothetical protein n=1 Tax=Pseudomonas fulva TaxID=47880 RepID=UPI0018AAFC56|nr:hypothetical protein [Pseudomonas fulva]MBF8674866.1 hypothetical protein [Pseudomonas fulva]MBF8696575.1 hypothetical protein [Pseudomonas fulva]